jgi:DNA polymerase I-like protein with 3'-5' exonuclease and polymerase domains
MAPRKKKVDYVDKDSSSKSVEKKNYEHYVKAAPILENFEEVYKLEHHLIKSYDELMDFYKNKFKPDSFFAWDTETTSLSPEQGAKTGDLVEGRIVGYSFTQDGHNGYYVPLCHPDIAIGYKGLKVLYAMVKRSKLNLLYNARFDMRFLEFMTPEKYNYTPEPDEKIYPFDLSDVKYFDVQCAVWLSDTNVPMPSLKKSEKHFLGWNPPTFADTTGGEANFGYLPASQGYRYASIDALATYNLFFKTETYYAESGAAGKLDNESLYPIMRLENTPIYVDHDYLKSMRVDILKHLSELKQWLYTNAGTEYNINSNRELVGVFQQLGIDTGKRTSTGLMETNIKAIENYLVSHNDNEYLKKLIEYKKLVKFDNSYLEKLLEISAPDEMNKHPIRFNYFTCRVPCLTENNRVLIKDKGLVSIKDCKSGDYIWTQYGYKKVLWNNSHFANDIYKVTFKNGYTIEGTGHHPLLVNKTGRSTYLKYEWAGLSDLKPGEHIVLNHKPCEDYNTDIEYDFARLIGFIDGDGSIATSDRVKLCYWTGESDELKEYYGNLLSHYSNSELHYDLSQEESHHAIVQAVYNTKFNTYLHSLGVRGDGVPKCILNSSPKIWLAYLQGIWDSDGNISLNNDNRKYPQVGIKLIKKQTVHDIGLMLLMLGIPNSLLDINYYKNKPNCHEQLRCSVRDHIGYVLFKNLISDYMKSNKRLKFESLNIDNNYIEYAQTTVKSVEKIEDAIVYDIEVEDVHEYIANGIVTHNTGRLASGTDGKNRFFSHINFQSIPKPHSHNYHVHKATEEQIANGEDLCGWIFDDNPENSLGLTEGQDPHLNVRKAFTPAPTDEDSVIVSVDMKAEELRLVANVYNEPTWIHAFNTNQDVHKLTAIKIFGEENYCKEARKKAKCISGNSLLYTDSGIIPIREVNSSRIIGEPVDVDFKLATPEGFCKCSKFIYNGIKQTLKFNMNNGDTLEVTPDHLIRSNNKWIYAKDLNEKDYIDFESIETFNNNYQNINLTYITNATLKFTKELAYYFGAILGDGNISNKNVYFTSEDYELIQYMSDITKMYNLGLAHENVQKYTKTSNKPFIRLNCGAKKARDLCKDITLIDESGHKQFKVPDIVFKSPNDVKFAFIQGLFDTDGTISNYEGHKHNFCLEFCTKSKQLAIGCAHLLKSLGVSCRICDSYNKVYDRTYYKLKIRATSARQFKNLGGFRCIHKQQRLLKWCDNVFVKEYKKHYQILSIEKSESDVYDLTIENDSHSFLANGFVVHNCASFGILYGSSAYGFHNQFPDMSLEECEDFINTFKAALPSIEKGQKDAVRYAKKNGYVKTYFGRPRRVKYYLNSSDYKQRSFGERTVKNTSVQGAAGDCLKLMLIRLWKELFLPYKDEGVRWLGTIHDEVNYIVPKRLLKEVAPIIMRCQRIALPDWPVVLEPDLSIGTSFGSLIPFDIVYNEDGTAKEFVPQMEPLNDSSVVDEPTKEYVIPEVEDDYNYLQ